MRSLTDLNSRISTPSRLLQAPGPSAAQLALMLEAAMHVPDHGRLAPWRFLQISGEARVALGEILVARMREREPDAGAAALAKERLRFACAPCIITVIGQPVCGHKVPEVEQLLSGGAVCLSLLHAAHALGFAAQWLTSWAAYDPVITARLGLHGDEQVLGFIHIGSAAEPASERPRPDLNSRLSEWTP